MTEPAHSTTTHPPGEPAPGEAIERAFDAAQRLLFERIDLARLDLQEAVAGLLRAALAAGILALIGIATLTASLVVLLQAVMPLAAALAVTGLVHLALAGALRAARTRWRVVPAAEGPR
jgi:uncharacterized membrane protein YqjE